MRFWILAIPICLGCVPAKRDTPSGGQTPREKPQLLTETLPIQEVGGAVTGKAAEEYRKRILYRQDKRLSEVADIQRRVTSARSRIEEQVLNKPDGKPSRESLRLSAEVVDMLGRKLDILLASNTAYHQLAAALDRAAAWIRIQSDGAEQIAGAYESLSKRYRTDAEQVMPRIRATAKSHRRAVAFDRRLRRKSR